MTDAGNEGFHIARLVYGDMVKDAAMAIELAAVLIRRHCGEDALRDQQPLAAREDGDYWWIEGPPNKDGISLSPGPVHVKLAKANAGVASLHWTLPGAPNPTVKR